MFTAATPCNHAVPKGAPLKPDVVEPMKNLARPPTKPFAARLSLAAHALIHERARAAGVSTREWLERAILADRTHVVARKKLHPDLGPLLFQVNKAGNNLNQLAHHFNVLARDRPIVDDDVASAIEMLIKIEQSMTEALRRAD